MKCPYCSEENLLDARFCAECGRPLSGELPAYMLGNDDSLMDKVREVKEAIQKAVTEKNYKEILDNKDNPITNMLIAFAAWLVLRFVGIIPFVIIVRILAFLMGYVGLVFLLSMTYVYSRHQKEIDKRVGQMKGIDYKKSIREIVERMMDEDENNTDEEKEDGEGESLE